MQKSEHFFSFPQMLHTIPYSASHQTFGIKQFLAKKQKQNHIIPQWTHVKIDNRGIRRTKLT
jgi:ribosomal protein L39E